MRVSSIDKRNTFSKLLMRVPQIVNVLAKRSPLAVTEWFSWLADAEDSLKHYDMPECAQMAGLIASLYSVPRQSRKEKLEAALATVNSAQDIIYNIYTKANINVENVYTLFRQIIVPMRTAGIINIDGITDLTGYVNDLLRQMLANEQLSASVNGAIASVGKADVIRIIAELITEEL